jgi:hypothetical protein
MCNVRVRLLPAVRRDDDVMTSSSTDGTAMKRMEHEMASRRKPIRFCAAPSASYWTSRAEQPEAPEEDDV